VCGAGPTGRWCSPFSQAAQSSEKGLQAEMLLNLATAVREIQGPSAAEQLMEQSVNVAQEILHYDTAYDAASLMTEWYVASREMEKAGEWSAYALLFGPLLSNQLDLWVSWIVYTLSTVSETEDRHDFVRAMETMCRRLEDEGDFSGQLMLGVEAIRATLH
jgi:hypothetical protein